MGISPASKVARVRPPCNGFFHFLRGQPRCENGGRGRCTPYGVRRRGGGAAGCTPFAGGGGAVSDRQAAIGIPQGLAWGLVAQHTRHPPPVTHPLSPATPLTRAQPHKLLIQ